MRIHTQTAVAAAVLAFVGANGASALQFRTGGRLELSGRTFHTEVCPGPAAPGKARCHAHVVTDAAGNIFYRNASPNVTPAGYSPAQLRAAYGITGSGSAKTTVAIVDAYGYPNAAADLAVYRAQFNLPACGVGGCLTIVNQTGGATPPKTNTGWDQEQALDLDMVSTMCPGCKILLVQASSESDSDLATAVNTAASMGARVISNSYGGSEKNSTSYEPAYNHPGVAITASAGDNGYGPEFPATSPHVTAAGGTSLTLNGTSRVSETVWKGTGSGCSSVYQAPTWQVGTTANSLCKARMETDASAVADPATGVAVYGPPGGTRSAWMVFGGTSVSAPLLGGIYGEAGQAVTYASKIYANTGAFHDITQGSNGSCKGTYFCNAETGYDGPTGWGTPNGDTAF